MARGRGNPKHFPAFSSFDRWTGARPKTDKDWTERAESHHAARLASAHVAPVRHASPVGGSRYGQTKDTVNAALKRRTRGRHGTRMGGPDSVSDRIRRRSRRDTSGVSLDPASPGADGRHRRPLNKESCKAPRPWVDKGSRDTPTTINRTHLRQLVGERSDTIVTHPLYSFLPGGLRNTNSRPRHHPY
jgi:hypothetical protein